ncbi:hypothetical protein [Gracilibacillus thailandensis]|uniref:Uncharacterized protein n=1 Tax=Gracilibacillus thailandensis TaxID=563735 RepID=A0A6N7QTB6_9BACI|nr:hypothetical protein [Gracilibacillus thailandensis]MRI64774.1 hypothetical protein [Gracilibacillus thailandensis]
MFTATIMGIATGLMTNLSYDAFFENEDELYGRVDDAYQRARKHFYKKYGDKFGDELNSFLESQQNIDTVVRSMYYGTQKLQPDDFSAKSFNGSRDGSFEAVIDFIAFLEKEMKEDLFLSKIIAEKAHMEETTQHIAETREHHQELKDQIKKSSMGFERLIEMVSDKISGLFESLPNDFALSNQLLTTPNIDDSPPLLISNVVKREITIKNMLDRGTDKIWVHISGEISSGKTQFLNLMSLSFASKRIWVSLKGLDEQQAIAAFNATLASSSRTRVNSKNAWYQAAISKLKKGDIIIIDDMPSLSVYSSLRDVLIKVAKACEDQGVKILTAGSNDVGLYVKQQLGKDIVLSTRVPSFTEEETEELLLQKGAPSELAKKLSPWLLVITKGSPALLNTLTEYLASESWKVSAEVFDVVQRGEYAMDLNSEIQSILLEKIEDDEAKELLYRLSLIKDTFNNDYLHAVSNVHPEIKHPFEQLNKLSGYWITNVQERYTISPLVVPIGERNLATDVKESVHSEIAKVISKNKTLNPLEATKLLGHLLDAKKYVNLAQVFLNLLHSFEEEKPVEDYWGITIMWANTPLPQDIPFDMKLMIRVKQVMVYKHYRDNIDYILADINDMVFQKSEESKINETILLSCLLMTVHNLESDGLQSLKYLRKAFEILRAGALGEFEELIFDNNVEQLVWIILFKLHTKAGVQAWKEFFEELSSEQKQQVLVCELAAESSKAITQNIFLYEFKKTPNEREWEEALAVLNDLKQFAKDNEIPHLQYCTTREEIRILIEFLGRKEEANEKAVEVLHGESVPSEAIFMIHSMLAKQYLLVKEHEKAMEHYQISMKPALQKYDWEIVDALGEYSLCLARTKKYEESRKIQEEAIKKAEAAGYFPNYQIANLFGEYGISLWQEENKKDAFYAFENAVSLLLEEKTYEEAWKCSFSVLGHVLMYYSSILQNKKQPKSEEYWEPFRGMFAENNQKLASFFKEETISGTQMYLVMYAEGMKDFLVARKWLYKGWEENKRNQRENELSGYLFYRLPYYLMVENKMEDAFKIAIQSYKILQAVRIISQKGDMPKLGQIDVKAVLSNHPDLENEIVYDAVKLHIVPMMIYASTLKARVDDSLENVVNEIITFIENQSSEGLNEKFYSHAKKAFQSLLEPSNAPFEVIQEIPDIEEFDKTVLQALSYLATANNLLPKEALELHCNVLEWLTKLFKNDNYVHEKILAPFFNHFWTNRYIKERNYFNNTEKIDKEFMLLLEKKDFHVKELILLMSKGLKVNLSEEVMTFLNS